MDGQRSPLLPRARCALGLVALLPVLVGACPSWREQREASLAPVLLAQMIPVGHAENALGTLVVKRADGRLEQLRGRGSLPLFEGDECRTERGSQAYIRLGDGTQLAMNEDTTFTVRTREARGGGGVRVFNLLLGEMWMRTTGSRPIEVHTPAATAAIKGTEFNIKVLSGGRSILTVVQGMVEFRNESCSPCATGSVQQSTADRGQPCSSPAPVDAAAVVGWAARVAVH
jgi:ferric-dicitrate binding protein FerR (iron transport regulator)